MSSMTGAKGMSRGEKIPKGYKVAQMNNFTPEQMKLHEGLFRHVGEGSYLSRLAGGDESIFNQIEAPAMRQFSALQGNTASRFSGQGLGGRNSSGFQNTMNQGASDFASSLQAQRQSLQQNAIRDLMSMSGELLNQRPYERSLYKKEDSGFNWGGALGGLAGGVGGFFTGGPMGAMSGANAGYNVGSRLSGYGGSSTAVQGWNS